MRKARNSKGRFVKGHKSSKKRRKNGSKRRKSRATKRFHGQPGPTRKTRRRKNGRKTRKGKRIRPVIISSHGHLYRPKRSKYFKHPRKVNGRRRKHHTRRVNGRSIMASLKNVFQVRTVTRYLAIGGGIFGGSLLSRFLSTGVVPFTTTQVFTPGPTYAKFRPVFGFAHLALGTVIASKSRNKYIQDAGIGLAALGGFDLLTQILSKMGMVNLPTFSGMNVDMLSGRTLYNKGYYSGMNVNLHGRHTRNSPHLMGNARASDAENTNLADTINDMIS